VREGQLDKYCMCTCPLRRELGRKPPGYVSFEVPVDLAASGEAS
jgi:hypothetical protein